MKHEVRSDLLSFNPATQAFLGKTPQLSAEQVLLVRQELRAAQPLWAQRSLKERVTILRQLQIGFVEALDEITSIINKETGKSRQDALVELFALLDIFSTTLQNAERWLRRESIPSGLHLSKLAYTQRRPYGTVAILSPWSEPFLLTLQPALTALVAGNCVLIKPSEYTPKIGELIDRLFKRVPELTPFVRVVQGGEATEDAVIRAKPDLIFLTGSVKTAKRVALLAAEQLIPTQFQLGGNNPLIVLPSADLAKAAQWTVWASCYNAGQNDASIERIYVLDPVYDLFLSHLLQQAHAFRYGYSEEVKAPYQMGCIINEKEMARLEGLIAEAVAQGATILCGGKREGLFMPPTILTNVTQEMRLMQEGSFGPILPVMRVHSVAEAIQHANERNDGVGASVWGTVRQAEAVLAQLDAEILSTNDALGPFALPSLPFGGVKLSGNRRAHASDALRQFTTLHTYLLGQPPFSADLTMKMRLPGQYRMAQALTTVLFGNMAQKGEIMRKWWQSQRIQGVVRPILDPLQEKMEQIQEKIGRKAGL